MSLLSKFSILIVGLSSSLLFASDSFAETNYVCSAPPVIEGELLLWISNSRDQAQVSRSTGERYPTRVVSAGGPVQTFDFDSEVGTERIIVAIDGSELHLKDPATGSFRKVGDLFCEH